jgi:hypothetical protein
MGQPAEVSVPASESPSDDSSAYRLVIRVKFARDEPPPAPVRGRFNIRALFLILIPVIAVLSWWGISMLRTHPTSARPAKPAAVMAPPVAKVEPAATAAPKPAATAPSAVNEVIPNVSQSSRASIRGTIRVSVRMIVDPKGNVAAVTADDAGSSRYFTRLAVEASKKWTFAPTDSKQQRIASVKFAFSRDSTTAHLTALSTSG